MRSAVPERGEQALLQSLSPCNGPDNKRRKNMNDQNRVLVRRGARVLNEEEVEEVCGGLRTATKCTLTIAGAIDGDLHSECGGDV